MFPHGLAEWMSRYKNTAMTMVEGESRDVGCVMRRVMRPVSPGSICLGRGMGLRGSRRRAGSPHTRARGGGAKNGGVAFGHRGLPEPSEAWRNWRLMLLSDEAKR